MIPLLVSVVLAYPHAIGTIEIGQGGQCGGTQWTGMQRKCQYPLTCQFTHGIIPGGSGTCEYPGKQTLYSGLNGKCGSGDSPQMTKYICDQGLQCVPSGIPGSYGTCQKQTLYSGLNGKCGWGDSPSMTKYICNSGLQCQPSRVPGSYGRCVDSYNPKTPIVSGLNGKCGSGDSPSMDDYVCESWLTCQMPWGVQGGYGTCVDNSGPSPSPSPSAGGEGAPCGSIANTPGYFYCQEGLTCVGGTSKYYGSCQSSYVGPVYGGRRRLAGANELTAPLR
jgi:hypothetical protein